MWLDYAERYDKVMYGTDWPLINIKSYLDVMKAVIPAEHHEDVFITTPCAVTKNRRPFMML